MQRKGLLRMQALTASCWLQGIVRVIVMAQMDLLTDIVECRCLASWETPRLMMDHCEVEFPISRSLEAYCSSLNRSLVLHSLLPEDL